MENPSPIKRHKAIVSFSKDHHFGLLLVWKIRQGLDRTVSPERISKYVLYFFKEDLAKHFRDEEEMLFNQLSADDPMRRRAESEHANLYKLVKELEQNASDSELLKQFSEKLDEHIRFEEREFFNYLQSSPNIQLEEVSERDTDNSRKIDDAWDDCFWK